jgi:hypothetical protein
LIFAFVLTYGGAALAIFNPAVGLLVYVAFAVLKPDALWSYAIPAGSGLSFKVAIAMLVGWLLQGFGNWNLGRSWPIVAALLGYFCVSFASALAAPHADLAWVYVIELSKIVLPFLVALTMVRTEKDLMRLAWVLVVSGGYLALQFNQEYYNGRPGTEVMDFAGMDEASMASSLVALVGPTFLMALTVGPWWQKLLLLAIGLLEVNAIFFSMSRGAMLGLGVSGLVLFLVIPKKPVHYALFLVAAAITLRLAGPSVREEFATSFNPGESRDDSAQSRLDLWAACWDATIRHPLLGVGPNHFPTIAHEYGFTQGKEAHSTWFQMGAELGFPGVICFMLFFILAACQCIRLIRSPSLHVSPKVRNIARMVLPSIAGYCVSAQFITMEGIELPFYLIMLASIGEIISENAERDAASGVWGDEGTSPGEPLAPEAIGPFAGSWR